MLLLASLFVGTAGLRRRCVPSRSDEGSGACGRSYRGDRGVNALFAPFAVSLYEIFAPGSFLLGPILLADLLAYLFLSATLRVSAGRQS